MDQLIKELECHYHNENPKVAICEFCHIDLCANCLMRWNHQLNGEPIKDYDDFLISCKFCLLDANNFTVPRIAEIRRQADELIQELVEEFKSRMIKKGEY